MKISEKPTNHILVRASTHSTYDSCNYAIITCGKEWIKSIRERLTTLQKVEDVRDFHAVQFLDDSVNFFQRSDDNASELLSEIGEEKDWAFIELEEGEKEGLTFPDSSLDCYSLVLYGDGTGRYIAYGAYTGEEFFTEPIPIEKIAAFIQNHEI